MLGVPGLFDVYRAGRVTIVNAPGAGIADDKAIYSYIPEIIEFYTGRAPILKNVPTYNCRKPDELKYVLEHLAGAGREGSARLGRLRHAGRPDGVEATEIEAFRASSKAQPRQLHRPADAGALDLPDARRRRASPRATSICGPFVLVGDRGAPRRPAA